MPQLLTILVLTSLAASLRAEPVPVGDYKGTIKLAYIGDSITYGSSPKDRLANSYPGQLGTMLGAKWEVKNFGVSGATMLRKADNPYMNEKAFKEAIAWQPDVVVIKLGSNDSKGPARDAAPGKGGIDNWQHKNDFADDCKLLMAEFRKANPKVRIYLCNPVPAFPGNFNIRDSIIRTEQLPILKAVAAQEKVPLIDLYAALADKKELFPDKVHPNVGGAKLIAEAVHMALTGK